MTTDRRRESLNEILRIEFEFFKHMTTLSGAAVIGVVAISEGFDISGLPVTAALVSFAAAAYISGLGMWISYYQSSLIAQGKGEYRSLTVIVFLVYVLFGGGLLGFLLNAVVFTWLRIALGLVVPVTVGIVALFKFVRARNSRGIR